MTYAIRDESNGRVVIAQRNRLKLLPSPNASPEIEYVLVSVEETSQFKRGERVREELGTLERREEIPVEVVERGEGRPAEDVGPPVEEQAPVHATPPEDVGRIWLGDAIAVENRVAPGEGKALVHRGATVEGDARVGRDAQPLQATHVVTAAPKATSGKGRAVTQHAVRQSTREEHPPRRYGDEKTQRFGNTNE